MESRRDAVSLELVFSLVWNPFDSTIAMSTTFIASAISSIKVLHYESLPFLLPRFSDHFPFATHAVRRASSLQVFLFSTGCKDYVLVKHSFITQKHTHYGNYWNFAIGRAAGLIPITSCIKIQATRKLPPNPPSPWYSGSSLLENFRPSQKLSSFRQRQSWEENIVQY